MKVLLTTLNTKFIHPNLALRWIYVARDPAYDVVLREFTINDSLDTLCHQVIAEKPDVILLSIYIWNAEKSKEWIRQIKKNLPRVRILIGGPEVSFESEDWLTLPIEAILRGEGEKTVWQAVRGENPQHIHGYHSKTHCSPVSRAKVDLPWLETLKSPYFLPLDREPQKNRYLYIETSRGCPYACSYCLSSTDTKVRLFSEKYILAQLTQLKAGCCKQVKFLDRTFNVNPHRALKFAQTIETLPVDFSFQFEVMLDILGEELLTFFENSTKNRYRLEVGVQTFNQKSLKSVNRHQNQKLLIEKIIRLKKAGCHLHVDLIAGLPHENLDSFKDTFHQLFACKGGEIQVGILKLLKGTPLRQPTTIASSGIQYNPAPPYQVTQTAWLSPADLKKIEYLYQATERYYNNGRAKVAIELLFDHGYDIFEILIECGEESQKLFPKLQIQDQFTILHTSIQKKSYPRKNFIPSITNRQSDTQPQRNPFSPLELQAILLTDYLKQFKKRPKPLFQRGESDAEKLNKKTVSKLYQKAEEAGIATLDKLYHYGKPFIGFTNNRMHYFVVIYGNTPEELPQFHQINL